MIGRWEDVRPRPPWRPKDSVAPAALRPALQILQFCVGNGSGGKTRCCNEPPYHPLRIGSMLRMKAVALAIVIATIITATPSAVADEIEHAYATISAIDRDLGAVHKQAGYYYEQMRRAQFSYGWHAWMERERGAQMNRSNCVQPPSPIALNYCVALYRDMHEHARWRRYWNSVIETSKAHHLAAVRHIEKLNQASYWWKNRFAMLQRQRIATVWLQRAADLRYRRSSRSMTAVAARMLPLIASAQILDGAYATR